ncbi:MAG: QueT transporter family protein, partial [Defluviitaleaceae bacterium]|nr:QueT transporter family protein [Defluviitaleaceae bacterium]
MKNNKFASFIKEAFYMTKETWEIPKSAKPRLARRLALTGITASVYTVLSLFFPYLAYGQIQCRFSEVLNLLAFINPVFAPGIILGCFITNLFSPFPLDWLFGTLATAAAMFCITRTKRLIIASLWPTAF